MAEIKETHSVEERPSGRATPWLAFLVGALLVAIVAFLFINAHGSFSSGPNGTSASVDVKTPAAPRVN